MAGGAASADAGGPHPEEPNGLGKGPALRCLVLHEDPLGLVGGQGRHRGPSARSTTQDTADTHAE
jgi:hypothetical protein